MKKTILTIAVMLGGVNLLMATGFEELKASAGNGLAVNTAVEIKEAGVLPQPAAVDHTACHMFHGEATLNADHGFGALEQLGVLKLAEDNAVAKCQVRGLLGCVATGSELGACNAYSCSAAATALPLVPVPGAVIFSATGRSENVKHGVNANSTLSGPYTPYTALDRHGVLKRAENLAVAKCRAAGVPGCVAIGSMINSCDLFSCSATGMAQSRTSPK